ncbi:hypothetical protein QUF74_08010 [Candidatus Halobeggiatoa sp. HSG11]|nr:hypothetical protein [Candidatus Halobeggiatoa sp. HSG11]
MKFLFQALIFGLLYAIMTISVFAGECAATDAATLEGCKDKTVKASGPRVEMFDVPEYFSTADPSFTGGEGIQDYMNVGDTKIILHTKDEVQCPENIEVIGNLKQLDLGEGKAWVVEVTEFKCL